VTGAKIKVLVKEDSSGRSLPSGKIRLRVLNLEGKSVFTSKNPLHKNSKGEVASCFEFPLPDVGHYTVQAENSASQEKATSSIAVLPSRPAAERSAADSIFGLCGGAIFHLPEAGAERIGKDRLEKFPVLDCMWGRNDLWWSTIEPEQGRFDWTRADLTVRLNKDNKVNLLGILCYASAWSAHVAPASAEEIDRFANYAKATVSRYKDTIRYWEVWNEPNLAQFYQPEPNPQAYARMLEAAYRAIKKVDASAFVLGGVTSGTDLGFLDKVGSAGGFDYMDALSVHPYQCTWDAAPGTHIGNIKILRDLCTKYSVELPVWVTELGVSSERGFTELQQADYLVKSMLTTAVQPKVQRVYWFNLTDWGGPDGCFGLCHPDGTPKPSLLAFRQLLLAEHGSRLLELEEPVPDVVMHKFVSRKGRKQVRVLWSREGEKEVSIRMVGLDATLSVQDVFGREVFRSKKLGTPIPIQVGESPLYLFTKDPILVEPRK